MNYQAAGRLLFSQLEEEGNLGLLCGPIVVFLLAIRRSKPFGSAPTVPAPQPFPVPVCFSSWSAFPLRLVLLIPPPLFVWQLGINSR